MTPLQMVLFCFNCAAFLFCEGAAVVILVRRAPLTFRAAVPYAAGAALAGCLNIPFIVLGIGRLHG